MSLRAAVKPRVEPAMHQAEAGSTHTVTQVAFLSLFQTYMTLPVFSPPPIPIPAFFFLHPVKRAIGVKHPRLKPCCCWGSLVGTAPAIPIHLCLLTKPGRVTDHLTWVLMTKKSPLPLKLQYMDLREYIQTEAGVGGGAEGKVPRQREMRCGKARQTKKKQS